MPRDLILDWLQAEIGFWAHYSKKNELAILQEIKRIIPTGGELLRKHATFSKPIKYTYKVILYVQSRFIPIQQYSRVHRRQTLVQESPC